MDVETRKTAPPARWEWTEAREQAAALVALGDLKEVDIAEAVGIDRNTLWWWKTAPAFQERVTEHLTYIREQVLKEGIAVKANRLKALNDRWQRMQSIIEERAVFYANHESEEVREVPGAKSGLLVQRTRVVGSGTAAQVVEDYTVDAALLREMRRTEEHAAREVGEWTDKPIVDVTQKLYIGIDLDRL